MYLELLAAKSQTNPKDIAYFVIFVIAAVGWWQFSKARKAKKEREFREQLLANGHRVQAMVVFHTHRDGHYYPKLKFLTLDGREFKVVSDSSWKEQWPAVGTKVELIYDPSQPATTTVVAWPPR